MNQHLLSIVLFTPLAGLIVLLFLPSRNKNLIRLWANLVAFAGFLVSIPLVTRFDRGIGEFQMVERASWIPSSARCPRRGSRTYDRHRLRWRRPA